MFTTTQTWWKRTGTVGLLGAAAIGFFAGKLTTPSAAHAAGPTNPPQANEAEKRLVAYLHGGKVQITREELGEYLIARFGAEKIDLLVNKVIIETACKERNIEVTDAEIEAALQEDLKGIQVDRQQFISGVLKQYGKTMYEWREDVLRPKIQIMKLCKLQISVNEDDIKKAFDGEFGKRVDGRIIIWPKTEDRIAKLAWSKIRQDEEEFKNASMTQASAALASSGGRIKPFGRGVGMNAKLEEQAFSLKEGQVSALFDAGTEGIACFKCDKIIPPDAEAKLEDHRERLSKVVFEQKLAIEVPKKCRELRDAAQPKVLLARKETPEDVERNAKTLIQQTGGVVPK